MEFILEKSNFSGLTSSFAIDRSRCSVTVSPRLNLPSSLSPLFIDLFSSSSWSHFRPGDSSPQLSFRLPQVRRQQHFWLCPDGRSSFLYFTRRFWNQIFTCFSDSRRLVAISIRRSRDRYMFEANSRSNSNSWVLVNAVRMRFELLLMELGDFGGGVGVLLRDEDSLGVETSEEKGQRLMAWEMVIAIEEIW